MRSADLDAAIADLVAIGEAESGSDPARLEDLAVLHARDLTGLETLASLRTLSLIGCGAGDYRGVRRLARLRLLAIEHSDLSTLTDVLPEGLQVLVVRSCRLSSVGAADLPAGLQVLDVSGNPLDASGAAAVDAARARGVDATRDPDGILALNARLARTAPWFVCAGTPDACILTASGREVTSAPERVRVTVSADEVEAALAAGTLHELAGIR